MDLNTIANLITIGVFLFEIIIYLSKKIADKVREKRKSRSAKGRDQ